MNDKYKGMITGAFVADSLALGAHWVYDTSIIDKVAGRITELGNPIAKNFHPNRAAGGFTHYGDQMLLFFKYLKNSGSFEPAAYLSLWKDFYDSYDGYKDHAMQDTRLNITAGKAQPGSGSGDLSGVFYVPILAAMGDDPDKLRINVEAAVRMTHDNESVINSALFLMQLLIEVLSGRGPVESVKKILGEKLFSRQLTSLIDRGLESTGRNTRTAIAEFGQSCPADYGLPGVIHLIGTYENDFESGMIANVMAGGDSAARGIFAGAVLGAHNGAEAVPERWRSGLSSAEELETLLS